MARKRKKRRQRRDWDSPWKETLQHFLRAVLAFFFPDLHDAIDWSKGYESLDKEFQQIVADARAGRAAERVLAGCIRGAGSQADVATGGGRRRRDRRR